MEHLLHIFGIGGSCGEHTMLPAAMLAVSAFSSWLLLEYKKTLFKLWSTFTRKENK